MKKFDFAIVTTGLQGAVLAAALTLVHRKKVLLFLDDSIPHRLVREICCSFICATRPETGELLENARGEAVPFLSRMGGPEALSRVSPLILTHTKAGADALAHLYHGRRGNDHAIERLANADFASATGACRVRGARSVCTSVLWPAVLSALVRAGVEVFSPENLRFSHHRDGSSTINNALEQFAATRVVLADDRSVADFASEGDRHRLLSSGSVTSLVAAPESRTGELLVQHMDTGLILRMKRGQTLEILAGVSERELAGTIGLVLGRRARLRRLAQTRFQAFHSRDGAPIAGKLGRSAFWGFAGFGHAGIFAAPLMARALCDELSNDERDYLEKRTGGLKRNSELIADFTPRGPEGE